MKATRILLLFIVLVCFYGCTKDIDVDQLDKAEANPTIITTLVYFNLGAQDFLDDYNEEIQLKSDIITAPFNDVSEDYLRKIEFTVVTENGFNKEFSFDIIFYNIDNIPIYKVNPTLVIPRSSGEIRTVIEIPTADIKYLFDAQTFGFFLNMSNTFDEVISPDDRSKFKLKSSLKAFLNFKQL